MYPDIKPLILNHEYAVPLTEDVLKTSSAPVRIDCGKLYAEIGLTSEEIEFVEAQYFDNESVREISMRIGASRADKLRKSVMAKFKQAGVEPQPRAATEIVRGGSSIYLTWKQHFESGYSTYELATELTENLDVFKEEIARARSKSLVITEMPKTLREEQ
jgi:hypothetical protein